MTSDFPASSPSGDMKSTKLSRWLNSFYDGKKCAAAIRVDANTDLGRMRVSQLKHMLAARDAPCLDCLEKADFIRRVREVYGVA